MNEDEKKLLTFTTGNKGSKNVRCITLCDYDESHFDSLLSIARSTYDFYCAIIHDKDSNDSGRHLHLVCFSKGGTTLQAHIANFESVLPGNFICRGKNIRSLARYLIHIDSPEKFQYSPDEVITNDPDRYASYISESSDSQTIWADFVLVKSSRMSVEDFISKYRSDFFSMPFYQKISIFNKLYDYFGGANHASSLKKSLQISQVSGTEQPPKY